LLGEGAGGEAPERPPRERLWRARKLHLRDMLSQAENQSFAMVFFDDDVVSYISFAAKLGLEFSCGCTLYHLAVGEKTLSQFIDTGGAGMG